MIIVIPTYKETLDSFESISLRQVMSVLEYYPICFVHPKSLSIRYSELQGKSFEQKSFSDLYFCDTTSYSRLLLSEEFYQEFIDYDYMLIYQLDAFVFKDTLSLFCNFGIDYIGTPIFLEEGFWSEYHIGNGGFSLRNVKKSLVLVQEKEEILKSHPYRDLAERAEDVFFSFCAGNDEYDFCGASLDMAREFAVLANNLDIEEYVYKNGVPFGIHYFPDNNIQFWGKFIRAYGYQLPVKEQEQSMRDYLDMMNQWLILKQEGKNIADYLLKCDVNSIAVYGLGIYGRHLIRDLNDSEVTVSFAIDRKPQQDYKGVHVITPDKPIEGVDLIINSVLSDRDGIEKTLLQLTEIPVVAIDDLIFESYFIDDNKAPWRKMKIEKR